jgi:hypothetical protein
VNSCRLLAQSAETAAAIIFKIPREIAGFIARFSLQISISTWGDLVGLRRMRCDGGQAGLARVPSAIAAHRRNNDNSPSAKLC